MLPEVHRLRAAVVQAEKLNAKTADHKINDFYFIAFLLKFRLHHYWNSSYSLKHP